MAAAYGGGRRTEARKARRRPNARRFNDITLAEAAARVLAPRKKPMHYKELTETIRKRGLYRSESKSLSSTVMIALTRDRRFRRVEPGVFEMKGD